MKKLMIVLAIIISIILGFVFIQKQYKAYVEEQILISEEIIAKEKEAYEKRKKEEALEKIEKENKAEYNVFDKLDKGGNVNIRIIGNSDIVDNNYERYPKWQASLGEELIKYRADSINYENISNRGASILFSWIMSKNSKSIVNDLVIIEIDDDFIGDLSADHFIMFYKSVLNDLLIQNPRTEILILKNYKEDKSIEFEDQLRIVNDDYQVSVLDIKDKDLESIISIFKDYVANKVEHNKLDEDREVIDLDIIDSLSGPVGEPILSASKGFTLQGDLTTSSRIDSFIEYRVNEEFVMLTYISDVDGGSMDIFVNDQLVKTIDTQSDVKSLDTDLISSGVRGEKTIRIVVSKDTALEESIVIYKLLTN